MRISDWSSDVCSSDLTLAPFGAQAGESVTYTVDGADYEGYSAPAEGSAKGLVLIIHDCDGLTGYEEKRAEMMAELGYDALALDLFGKGNRPAEVSAPQADTGQPYKQREQMRRQSM